MRAGSHRSWSIARKAVARATGSPRGKLFCRIPARAVGFVNGSISFSCDVEPGQPCVMTIGIAFSCLERTWMKNVEPVDLGDELRYGVQLRLTLAEFGLNLKVYSPATCQAVGTIPAYNLNLASLTAANVLGTQVLTRTVTNVGASSAVYNVSASLPGYTVAVTPTSLSLAPGAKGQYQVKLTRTTAPANTWTYGALSWTDGTHTVRSPLTARGTSLAAIPLVSSEAATGSKVLTLGTGFTGALVGVKSGLVEAVRQTRTIGQAVTGAAASAACKAGGATGVNVHNVVVPAGTLAARFATYDTETTGGANTDMDMEVYNAANVLVGSSGNESSNEQVELRLPAAGTYKVCVIGFAPQNGQADYTLSSWVLAPGLNNGSFKALMPGTLSWRHGVFS